jgi:hypothetical protein
MDLGNGRGRECLGVDTDEDVGPELLVDDRLDQLEGLRRHLVDQPRELLDVHVGEEIRARGEQLAELQVGRPELLEREPELTGPARAWPDARRVLRSRAAR